MEEEEREKQVFDDTLDFNAWQIKPDFPKKYSDIIGKDTVLSNINNTRDMEYIDTNLQQATYLNGMTVKVHIGYYFFVEGRNEPLFIESTNVGEAMNFLVKDQIILKMVKAYEEKKVFGKSVHHKLSRYYSRLALSRGIKGQAAKDLKTVRHEEEKTLLDLTNRENWNPFSKKSPSVWGGMEMQK